MSTERSGAIFENRDITPKGRPLRMTAGKSGLYCNDDDLDRLASAAPALSVTLVRGDEVPITCPCCGQPVATPSLEIVVQSYGISEFEARILGAIWRGKGRPVATERIFDAMYADDPDGGPSHTKMYQAFKFGLHRLRGRLTGSGVVIENVGYRRGYRLLLKESAQ